MSFDEEMNDVKNAETSGEYIKKPCVEVVTLKSYKMSPNDHKGCPFIDIVFHTDGEVKLSNTARLYRVREGDSEDTKKFKNKRIKELLINAGADFNLTGEAILKSAMDKKVKALFKTVEYIGVDSNNFNKPEIRTKIEYSFSVKADEDLQGNQSYFHTPLNEKGQKQLAGDLAKWERDNPNNDNDTGHVAESIEEAPDQPGISDDEDPFS